ncbi:MAG: UDP-glucose/GDP-mannose dehydrogenase family protein [Pseudomonadota bacterium]
MNISIFGLGYVGAVSAACLARGGHNVIGVDPNLHKVDLINSGKCPIVEADLPEIIATAAANGQLKATKDPAAAIESTELSFVCVGTPSLANGGLDLKHVAAVCEEIGAALAQKDAYHTVVIRSTVLPGTMHGVVIPTLESASGKKAGKDFGLSHNPEFLREGTAVDDYHNPPKTVIGEIDECSGAAVEQLYRNLDAPLFRVPIEVAEMVKYTDNVWHALKISFANEIGTICKSLQIDSHSVMDVFCADEKLNLSRYYLRPGFAFGGSCLPKDVRALNYRARTLDLDLPVLTSILPSNQQQISRGMQLITQHGRKRVGFLGLSFKPGTDDLRESPLVELIERLIGKGYDVRVYDEHVNLAKLLGTNREFIHHQIPHISRIMTDNAETVLNHAEVLVIGNKTEGHSEALRDVSDQVQIVDLVRLLTPSAEQRENYNGICW